jgi:hypothetical protein
MLFVGIVERLGNNPVATARGSVLSGWVALKTPSVL